MTAVDTSLQAQVDAQMLEQGAFAPLELGRAFDISEIPEIDRWRRWDAMEIGVIADVVMRQCSDHIVPAPLFQYARLLAYDLERGAHSTPLQLLCDT